MLHNKLKINDDKTEFLLITSPRMKMPDDMGLHISHSDIVSTPKCMSLGVILDQHMTLDAHISAVCHSTHYHLRNIGSVRSSLLQSAVAQLIHALITSRLDYCNAMLYVLPDSKINRLQRIQNIAARIVTRTRRDAHITPILKQLHWLPVKGRILFKILLLTYSCVNGLAPKYLCELISLYKPSRTLRSPSLHLLHVPKYRLSTYGQRAFQVSAPTEWNKLPLEIRLSTSIEIFKTNLKTYLFSIHFHH